MPDQQQDGSRAAAWLLAEFDATDPADLIVDVYDPQTDGWTRPVHVQPMFTLKGDTPPEECGAPMHVNLWDYHDPWRWWL
jgi:hypothetical protein